MTKDLESYKYLKYGVKLVPISEEDGGGWLAEIPELKGCMSDGETPEEALKNVEEAKLTWISTALKRGQIVPLPSLETDEYSGKFTLRLPKFLHKELSLAAQKDDISLNQYILSLVALNFGKSSIISETPKTSPRKPSKSRSQ
ncbi:type II toxin-antitoxin system HicB family antitoxin [Phosphitispora fastidiosa]|uniref:type II toxin-antitoxin system HicB family antitoxin n=1 Tax=Phosphitispora fastidiosa TaxID=2837202 RepID=UPI001E626144|nr:type II toxin-antitoxin system HicB family antitoxin [Phosphitispora fastidiosa]MBU7008609.1 putative RNase H-like HicB family nuclease [Phosphitispora fastidiosa]